MATATKTRSILIQRTNGDQQIVEEIPANAKITFGPVNPGKPEYNQQNALRIYTTTNNQLAVFTQVQWFRDLSLNVKTRRRQEKQKREAKHDLAGIHVSTETEETYEWVDGDSPVAVPILPDPF